MPLHSNYTLQTVGQKNRGLPSLPKDEIKNKVLKYITDYVKKADPDHPEEVERTEKDILEIFRDGKRYNHLNLEV